MSKANGSEALVAEQLSKDRAVIELCRRSLVNHFVVRDMDAALAYMADDVEWLGPFSCQTASDKKTMEDILRPEYSIRLALADERWRARKRANTWIVSARYTLLVVSAGEERSMPFKQHATYVWAPTPDGPRIVHLHVWVIGKKVCPEPNRNPCDKGRLHAGHSIAQQCPSTPPLHLFR